MLAVTNEPSYRTAPSPRLTFTVPLYPAASSSNDVCSARCTRKSGYCTLPRSHPSTRLAAWTRMISSPSGNGSPR